MKLPASQTLFTYWTSLCNGREAPSRADLEPAAMRSVLPHTFLLEPDSGHGRKGHVVRLSGTRLDALFNRDLKGVRFPTLWAEEHQALLGDLLEDVANDVQPVVIGGRTAPVGEVDMTFELLALPLAGTTRAQSRLLCGLAFPFTPLWLGLRQVSSLTLTSWRALEANPTTVRSESRSEHRSRVLDRGVRRGHLVVFEGGYVRPHDGVHAVQSDVKSILSRS